MCGRGAHRRRCRRRRGDRRRSARLGCPRGRRTALRRTLIDGSIGREPDRVAPLVSKSCNAETVSDVDRELLADAVRTAYLPALLIALAQSLGDLSLLRDDLRPDPARVQEPTAGYSREQREAARELAIERLRVL